MTGNTRSHSPPLPPNATYNHPVIALNILPSAKLFVAGSKLTGLLEVSCRERNSVALGQLAIEFLGVEELKLLDHSAQASVHGPHRCIFQGPSLPPSNAVATSEAPIGGHYYTALRGRTKFPFAFPLPSKLPPSTHFGNKARVCYTLKATCQVLTIESRRNVLVTKSKLIQIVERMLDWNDSKYYEAVEMRGELREPGGSGAGVWAEVKINKRLHWHQDSGGADEGLIRAQLTVKNTSRRTLSGGVNAKICRALVLPDDKNSSHDSPVEIVRNCTFRGPEYEFPSIPGQAKTVNLICQLPNPFQDECQGSQDGDPFCFSAKGMKLFSLNMFLRVELELGALSNDLVIDLPIHIVHPSSLPKEAILKNTPLTIEHVPSPNPMSMQHLTQPSSSGRVSRNRPRSTSPHPPALQPGGSRCPSPQPSLSIGPMGDWGGHRSAAPSPVPSPHFSPLPSPCHSPLPTTRFSSPLPFSSSPATNLHHHPTAPVQATAPMYHPPTPNWSNVVPSYGADHMSMGQEPQPDFAYHHPIPPGPQVFPSYPYQPPATVQPAHDPYSTAGPSLPQCHAQPNHHPVFSPPATPWRRQTVPEPCTVLDGRPLQLSGSCPTAPPSFIPPTTPHYSSTQLPFSPPHSHPHAAMFPQEPLGASPFPQPDLSGPPIGQQWRVRHQSLPPVPVLSPYPQQNPNNQYYGSTQPATQNPFDGYESASKMYQTTPAGGLVRQSSNSSRRTSEPVISNQPWMNGNECQQRVAYSEARKRALPRPPLAAVEGGGNMAPNRNADESHYQESVHVQYEGAPRDDLHHDEENDPSCSSRGPVGVAGPSASRLETIGEVGESRAGTLCAKRMSQGMLSRLATKSDGMEDGDGPGHRRGPRRQEVVRVVSHPRGMRPRRSEGSESVQTLEDMVASEDARREARSTSPSPSLEQTPVPGRQQATQDGPAHPRRDEDDQATSQTSASDLKLQPVQRDPRRQQEQDGQDSRRPKSLPPRSTSRNRQGQSTGLANLAQFLNRTASAELAPSSSSRAASSHGQPGDGSVDGTSVSDQATRPLTPSYAGSALRLKSNQIHYDEAFVDAVPSPTMAQKPPLSAESVSSRSDWKPPTHEGPPLVKSSMVQRIGLCEDDEEQEEAGRVVANRESVAPEALFPRFEPEQRSSVGPTKTSDRQVEASAASGGAAPKSGGRDKSRSTTPLVIPTVSPLVKKKNAKTTSRLGNPTKEAVSEAQLPSPAHGSPAPEQKSVVQPQPATTVVERLRNQNREMMKKVTSCLEQGDDGAEVVGQEAEQGVQKEAVREAEKVGCSGLGLVMVEEAHAHPAKTGRDEDGLARLLLARAAAQDSQRAKASDTHGRAGAPREKTPAVAPQHQVPSRRESARATGLADPQLARSTGPLAPRPIKHFDQSLLSQSVMRRPLPISGITLDGTHGTRTRLSSEAPVSETSQMVFDPNTPTRALFSARKPRPAGEETKLLDSLTKASSSRPLSVPCREAVDRLNPTHRWSIGSTGLQLPEASGGEGGLRSSSSSSTNLARKSRIKRQVSSTMSPPEHGWGRTRQSVGGDGAEDGVVVSQVPGGWNETESNEIEAELIKALEETNRAVQKATSKRLSTPMFSKSPSFNTSLVLARAIGQQQAQAASRGTAERGRRGGVRASISMSGDSGGEYGTERAQRIHSGAGGPPVSIAGQSEEGDGVNGELVGEAELGRTEAGGETAGEYYKSMRGGRGGRVSSVAAKWAKLARESSAAEEEEGLVRWSGPGSSRGVSVLEKAPGRAASNAYSITSLLGRSGSGNRVVVAAAAEHDRAGSLQARRFGRAQDGNRGFGRAGLGEEDRVVGQVKMGLGGSRAGKVGEHQDGRSGDAVTGLGVCGVETSSGSSGTSSVDSYGGCSTIWSSSSVEEGFGDRGNRGKRQGVRNGGSGCCEAGGGDMVSEDHFGEKVMKNGKMGFGSGVVVCQKSQSSSNQYGDYGGQGQEESNIGSCGKFTELKKRWER